MFGDTCRHEHPTARNDVRKEFIIISIGASSTVPTLAEASQAPETKVRMSGDNDSDMTSPVWPVNDVVC